MIHALTLEDMKQCLGGVNDFNKGAAQPILAAIAAQGIYIGTSSWKYDGWLGQLYTPARYEYRGKVAASRFKRDCLVEYAETFKTVCVDAAYYTFPTEKYLQGMAEQTPEDFRFGLKVTDTITLKNFPNLDRFGANAGKKNDLFLNAGLFASSFLRPCESIRSKVGLLMFEFSRFWPADYAHGRDFVADLGKFLAQLPSGWPYGIEMRNKHWLQPEYFDCLARHQVAHVFNSWTEMPPISEQMLLTGSRTNPDLAAARFLLKPGRTYEQAVKAFQPYDSIKEPNEDARKAGAALIKQAKANARQKTYIFVNNRLEGNALATIKAILDLATDDP